MKGHVPLKKHYLQRPHIKITVYLAVTMLIGFSVILLSLDKVEYVAISELQGFVQNLAVQIQQHIQLYLMIVRLH